MNSWKISPLGSVSTIEDIYSESSNPHRSWLFSLGHEDSRLYWADKGCLVDTEEGTSSDVFDIILLSHCTFSFSSSSSSSFAVNGTLKASGNKWKITYFTKII